MTDPPDATGFLQGAIFIASGWYHSVAILSDNTVRAWGDGGNGQLGDGLTMDRSTPIQVEHPSDPSGFLTNVIDVDAGAGHTVSLLGDGTVRTWGSNLWGQLGDGTTIPRSLPVPVLDSSDPSGYLSGVADIDSGGSHVLARQ